MLHTLSLRIRHFFHVVSNVRPIVWICLYVALTPVFALIYWALPDGQFRIPDGAGTDFGSWLYYSIVTITTLGFGDYTPAHGWAQTVTAIEVMCGLIFLGLFLNAVGSMKSEIDVETEIDKQRRLHQAEQKRLLQAAAPATLAVLRRFLTLCDSPTPSHSGIEKSAGRLALALDSLQNRVDLTLWPQLLEGCFSFVADFQLYSSQDADDSAAATADFVKTNAPVAQHIETSLSKICDI